MKKQIIFLALFSSILLSQSDVLIMSPEPNSEISGHDVLIAISTFGMKGINPNNIQLLLDGEDISDLAYMDEDMVTCLLDQLDPGLHQIQIFIGGGGPKTWSFTTTLREPTLKYSGRIRSSSSMDQIDDQTLNISQVMVNFKGSAYEWMKFKTNVKITTQEQALYQPRNVLGFEIALKDYATINVGDSNPRLSHFTMNGKRIRGLNTNFKWSWFNLHFVQGEINRAIEGDLEKAYSYSIDTDDDGTKFLSLSRNGYTFKQNVMAGRLALGRGEKIQWGLNFMKARDDTNSVTQELNNAEIVYSPDATGFVSGLDSGVVYTISDLGTKAHFLEGKNWAGDGPKDNLVIGTDLGISLFNKRLRLDGELAFSMTNNNIWGGPLTLAQLDTMIDDSVDNKLSSFDLSRFPDPADYENILIINPNLAPLVPIDINAFGDSATVDLTDAVLSMPSLAYRGRAITNFYGNYLAVEYSQVGPEFNSLANPYLVKNKREFSISDKLKLLQNRLMLTMGYKHQDDDILTTVENLKSQNTMSLGINALPGPGLPTLNFTYRSIDRDNGIDKLIPLTDSTFTDNRENTHTNNIMMNISHRFDLVWSHALSGTFVNVNKTDKFTDRDTTNFVDPAMSTNVMNFTLSTRYNFQLKTTLNLTINSSELSTGPGERGNQDFLTTNFDAEYPFFKNQILGKAGLNYAQGSGLVDMSWIGFKSGIKWKIFDQFSVKIHGEYRSKKSGGLKKNTVIARANLEYSF
ncbi:MAG TPA: hypothetical protein QGF51_01855 [Candidatus Marinimicrobia bacterium]|nr:hypothetical protein [Candidatus Neomarinimicrobiota bacterium]